MIDTLRVDLTKLLVLAKTGFALETVKAQTMPLLRQREQSGDDRVPREKTTLPVAPLAVVTHHHRKYPLPEEVDRWFGRHCYCTPRS